MIVPRLSVKLLPVLERSKDREDLIAGASSLFLSLGALPLTLLFLIIIGLTVLELSICVAAKHLRDDSGDQMNLEMLFDNYQNHLRRGRTTISARGFTKNAFAMASFISPFAQPNVLS